MPQLMCSNIYCCCSRVPLVVQAGPPGSRVLLSRSGADQETRARGWLHSAPSVVLAPFFPFPSPRTLSTEIGSRPLTYTKLWDVEGMEEERRKDQTEAAIPVESGTTARDTGASRGAKRMCTRPPPGTRKSSASLR